MKKIIILMVLIVITLDANKYDEPDKPFFLQKDKQLHIAFTASISMATSLIAYEYGLSTWHSALIGFSAGMLVGITKEIKDTNFDNGDILSDAIGSGLGVMPVFIIYEW